jgi:plasmid maintenance system antidote protein VapI
LTAETALRLAKFFGTSAAFWIGLQSEHDLEVAERAVGARIKREVVSLATLEPNKAWLDNRRLALDFS